MAGLLFISKCGNAVGKNFEKLLEKVSSHVKGKLYIYLNVDNALIRNQQCAQDTLLCRQHYRKVISDIYKVENTVKLNFRVLLSHLKNKNHLYNFPSSYVDVIITDTDSNGDSNTKDFDNIFKNYHQSNINLINFNVHDDSTFTAEKVTDKTYDYCVLGGTFDHLHSGHKVLLSEAVMLTDKGLTIGVSEESMLKDKVLYELAEPLHYRMSYVEDFLKDIDSTLTYHIEPICDAFGPSITDPNLNCIVVSDETYKGGLKVNEERNKRGLSILDVHSVTLVPSKVENEKVSSTQKRFEHLGNLVNVPSSSKHNKNYPYIVGLTGGIASGKTSIGKYLKKLGAHVINCDELGHKAYIKGSKAFEKIVETFGSCIIDKATGEVNRKVLGPMVFSSPNELEKLNNIVWPEIMNLAKKEIDELIKDPNCPSVVVLDAAVLIEAGWNKFVDQTWICIIPKQEAVKRIIERNGLSKEDANMRIESQMTNSERLKHANAIFSTLWDYEITRKQVNKAWLQLNNLIKKV